MAFLRALAVLALAALAPACCLTGGWHECDSSTYEGGCEGRHYSYCLWTSNPWSGPYEQLLEGECGPSDVCIEPSPGLPACVPADSHPCDASSYVERCEGGARRVCMSPSAWVTDTYELPAPCPTGTTCAVVDGYVTCVGAP